MTRYLSVAETAKLVRNALKVKFPGTKFSVRSKSYSGGASINVEWTDGPTSEAVRAVTGPFEGAGFDGMIDLKYHKTAYLLPNGTAVYGKSTGTVGSAGVVDAYDNPLPKGAEPVSFGADYIFTSRHYSDKFLANATAAWNALTGEERMNLINSGKLRRTFADDYNNDTAMGRRLAEIVSV